MANALSRRSDAGESHMSLIVRGPKAEGGRSWGPAGRVDAGPVCENRRVSNAIHVAAVIQLCENSEGRASYRRKRAEAKRPNLDLERIAPVRRQVLSERPYRLIERSRHRRPSVRPHPWSGAATPLECGRTVRSEDYGSRIATTWPPRAAASAARS